MPVGVITMCYTSILGVKPNAIFEPFWKKVSLKYMISLSICLCCVYLSLLEYHAVRLATCLLQTLLKSIVQQVSRVECYNICVVAAHV